MGTSPAASEHCELLAEGKILDDQACPRAEGRQQRADERLNNRIHVLRLSPESVVGVTAESDRPLGYADQRPTSPIRLAIGSESSFWPPQAAASFRASSRMSGSISIQSFTQAMCQRAMTDEKS